MNIKAFFVDALGGALDLGIGTPEDVLRHVTPDVLAQHLPRPLWARLLTACLGAPRVDAQLDGRDDRCRRTCASTCRRRLIWAASPRSARARSASKIEPAPSQRQPVTQTGHARSVPPPPPDVSSSAITSRSRRVAIGPSIPAPSPTAAANNRSPISSPSSSSKTSHRWRPRTPTAPRFRQSNTQSGRVR